MLNARVRLSAVTNSGTDPYSTDEVPLSATPIAGSKINANSSGSGSSARMPSAVQPSVSHTVATTPMRAPIQAQTSLPAAPPTNTSVSARPTVGSDAPFAASRNGRQVSNPLRVALSMTPIESSTGNPPAGGSASGCSGVALDFASGA